MDNTFIIPIIRDDLIERCLETLYKHTPLNFYVFVIDQSVKGIDSTKLRNQYPNLMVIRTPKTPVHNSGNLGFAKATNLGISLVETPYFTMCNDDVEFINSDWWQGILDSFTKVNNDTPSTPCVSVTPSSFKFPGWSLGRQDDLMIVPYKENYTQDEYDHLVNDQHYLNEHLTLMPNSVIDGITFYCSVFKTKEFMEIGLLDEHYYPGGGEDYDWCCLAYMNNYRCVGTTKSWVLHHWSKSFATINDKELVKSLVDDSLRWNQNHEKWGKQFDTWGVKCSQCQKQMRVRENPKEAYCPDNHETYKIPESVIVSL